MRKNKLINQERKKERKKKKKETVTQMDDDKGGSSVFDGEWKWVSEPCLSETRPGDAH